MRCGEFIYRRGKPIQRNKPNLKAAVLFLACAPVANHVVYGTVVEFVGSGSPNATWNLSSNWMPHIPGSSDEAGVDFSYSADTQQELGTDFTIETVEFDGTHQTGLAANGSGGGTTRTLTLLGDGTSGDDFVTIGSNYASKTFYFGGNVFTPGELDVSLGAVGGINVASTAILDVSAVVKGSGALVKDGAGQLDLGTFFSNIDNAQNTYSGGTTLSTGILKLDMSSSGAPGSISFGPIGTGGLTITGGTH